MDIKVYDSTGSKSVATASAAGSAEPLNKAVVYYAVKAARNNLRHGTAAVKDRSAVNMTNKKIVKQKGSGGARHGARSANIFVGGASAHGPRPRSYVEKMNKQFKTLSYQELFNYHIGNQSLVLVNEFKYAKPSTAAARKFLDQIKAKDALVILPQSNEHAKKSFRNLRDVKIVHEDNINLYDLANYNHVIMAANYFETIKQRYSL